MKYRKIGKYGIKVSEISLGAWLTYGGSVDARRTAEIVHAALDAGVNFLDIADIYAKGEAERVVGKAIEGRTRSDLVISSKLFWPMSENINDRGLSRKHIMESIEKSLKRIGTDYLDLYFCHRYDKDTEIEEVVCAMSELVTQGKILYWGTSVWEADQIERAVGDARAIGGYLPAIEQPRYNMLDRHIEDAVLPTCAHHGMGVVVWSPLAQGILTGKYNSGVPKGTRGADTMWLAGQLTEDNLDKARKLTALAKEAGMTIAQMALAWILRRPEISAAIVGATNVTQLKENLAGSDTVLSPDLIGKIDAVLGQLTSTRFKF